MDKFNFDENSLPPAVLLAVPLPPALGTAKLCLDRVAAAPGAREAAEDAKAAS